MGKEDILFTVFTATYNRATLLPRVYASLQKQTCRDFEWVIIDDGSADGTGDLVEQWQAEADFPIVYQWQPNQGKHIAYNAVAKIARGELFTSIDSDDEALPFFLERIKFHWDQFSDEEKQTVGGVTFLNLNQHGEVIGDKFPKDHAVMDLMEMYFVNRVKGDKGGMVFTKTLRVYPFPENLKNVLVPEGTFMYKFAHDWKMCFINEALTRVWVEGRADSLSLFSTTVKNYPGMQYCHQCFLNYNLRFFKKRPKLCIGEATRYASLSFHLGIGLKKQFSSLKPIAARILWVACMPLGFAFFVKDKLFKSKERKSPAK